MEARNRDSEKGQFDGPKPMGRNHHPTVKPTDLMRYLCRLITPPGGLCLDPFTGSGSTGKAALLESFRFVGIERDPDYLEIAKARIQGEYSRLCSDLFYQPAAPGGAWVEAA